MEAQTIVPSLQSSATPWQQRNSQAICMDVLDRDLLEDALNVFQLASESARRVLLPAMSHRITVRLRDLGNEIGALVASGRIGAARSLLPYVEGSAGHSWSEVLALPTTATKPKTGRSDFHRNADWIRRNRAAFAGVWVALADGELIDHDKSRVALHRRLQDTGQLVTGTLIAKV